MANRFFYGKLFSNSRSQLIDSCISLQKQGENFLYILPSREAMKQVRQEILKRNNGVIGSNIIMFDELEVMLTKDTIKREAIIEPNCENIIIKTICEDNELNLSYYNKIKEKEGFQKEVRVFIKYLKRNLIDEKNLKEIIDKEENTILKNKLMDMATLYSSYNNFLKKNSLYDINDISILAIKAAKTTKLFENYSTIIIDGFLNIDKVNMELIKVVSEDSNLDITVNCPYKTDFTDEFLKEELINNFKKLSFEVKEDTLGEKEVVNEGTTELATKLFTTSKGVGSFENVKVIEYPSIKAEVIYTAKKIKTLLMEDVPLKDIAIYINNIEAYEEELNSVFSEYKIPINLSNDVPLSSYKVARDLAVALDALSEAFTIEEGIAYIKEYIDNLYVALVDSFEKEDIAVANSLRNLLSSLENTFKAINVLKDNIEKPKFINIVKENLEEAKVTLNKGNRAGIAILNTDLAKGIYFDYIFILGLNEGEVPVVPKSGGLFNEIELNKLKASNIAYKDWNYELKREKIRFLLTIASGKKEITLSYRSVSEEGKFAIASQFVDAVKFVTNNRDNEKITIRDYVQFSIDNSMTANELQKALLKTGLQLNSDTLSNYIDNTKIEKYKLNAAIEDIRKNKPSFTNYEGIITCDEYFTNHDQYINKLWFKDVESYIKCPMSFMFSKIFNINKYSESEEEEGINNKDKTIFYKNTLKDYYSKASEYDNLQEELLKEALENNITEIIEKYPMLNKDNEEISNLKAITTTFLLDDIKLRAKFNKQQGSLLKPFLLDIFSRVTVEGVSIGMVIDRVELEYKLEANNYIPTGRYIIYTYRKNTGYDITSHNLIKLDTIEPALLYKATEAVLKERFPSVKPKCLAVIFLSVEQAKRDGIYINEESGSMFAGKRKKGVTEDKLPIIMEHGYKYASNIIKDMKSGLYNYNLACDEENKFGDYKCGYMKLCRYYKSKGEVRNNV